MAESRDSPEYDPSNPALWSDVLTHADERVALEFLDHMPAVPGAATRSRYAFAHLLAWRGAMDATSEGMLWSPILDRTADYGFAEWPEPDIVRRFGLPTRTEEPPLPVVFASRLVALLNERRVGAQGCIGFHAETLWAGMARYGRHLQVEDVMHILMKRRQTRALALNRNLGARQAAALDEWILQALRSDDSELRARGVLAAEARVACSMDFARRAAGDLMNIASTGSPWARTARVLLIENVGGISEEAAVELVGRLSDDDLKHALTGSQTLGVPVYRAIAKRVLPDDPNGLGDLLVEVNAAAGDLGVQEILATSRSPSVLVRLLEFPGSATPAIVRQLAEYGPRTMVDLLDRNTQALLPWLGPAELRPMLASRHDELRVRALALLPVVDGAADRRKP